MATTRKAPAKPKASASKAGGKFNPEDLPSEGTGQFRQQGEYKASIRALGTFAKGDAKKTAHVKALVHLGWCHVGGVNSASKSPAFTIADNGGLTKEQWSVGDPAAPQISANLHALADLEAPAEALDGLWAAYVGV